VKNAFSKTLRRAKRLMRLARPHKALGRIQKTMTAAMVKPARKLVAKRLGKKPRARKSTRSRTAGTPARPTPTLRIPDRAQYLARTNRSASGARGYKLYVPASSPKRPVGLILMLHGCNQGADDFALGTHMNALAEKHGLVIAYPAQTAQHNAGACWNWFKPDHQQRGLGEPAILASLTRKLMREFGLARDAVFVAGLSAGGGMASILADVYPDIFSAAGIHSGVARGTAHNVVSAMRVMRKGGGIPVSAPTVAAPGARVRRIVFQGDADRTVHPSNAETIVVAAMGRDSVPAKIGKRTVRGRGYTRSDYAGPDGAALVELWMIEDAGHAWSGGRKAGSYTDSKGPDASAQMVRFFLAKPAEARLGRERKPRPRVVSM
jgi:poly(hydroxyalkanoate) depolymerase family esterase